MEKIRERALVCPRGKRLALVHDSQFHAKGVGRALGAAISQRLEILVSARISMQARRSKIPRLTVLTEDRK